MGELATLPQADNLPANDYRQATNAASICRDIVVATAQNIQGRRYVRVEGWMSIAVAHGCAASAHSVERIEGGVRAIGEIRRMSDGAIIATAEGFVGEDEPTWFGGESTSYGKSKTLPKRADYAIRAMAQTRAISRACRTAFAHVVVMMDAGLSTTPAEEVPHGGFDDANTIDAEPQREGPAPRTKLEGPHTSGSALKKAMHSLIAEVDAARSIEELDAIMTSAQPTLAQCREHYPSWLDGDPEKPEFVGFDQRWKDKRGELSPTPLLKSLLKDMRERDTLKSLTAWQMDGAVLERADALDDLERAIFESAMVQFEGGLDAFAVANA